MFKNQPYDLWIPMPEIFASVIVQILPKISTNLFKSYGDTRQRLYVVKLKSVVSYGFKESAALFLHATNPPTHLVTKNSLILPPPSPPEIHLYNAAA